MDARVAELIESGLKPAAIARRMKISHAWFSEATSAPTVGDKFVDRLCQTFGFTYTMAEGLGETRKEPEPAGSPDVVAAINRLEQSVSGLVNAHVLLLRRFDELLKEKEGQKK